MATDRPTVVGLAIVKDEADIIAETLTRMSDQLDHALVIDNGSTDGTREILRDLARRDLRGFLRVGDDPDPAYYQARKMTGYACELTAEEGWFADVADWIVPFDADERWYATDGRTIVDYLADVPEDRAIVEAELYDHVATALDDEALTPMARIGWRRREPAELPKVAFRPVVYAAVHMGNHDASYATARFGDRGLVVRHFPYRSPEQFVSKVRNGAAAYAATDLPEHYGAHWRQYGAILAERGPAVLVDEVFRPWFFSADPDGDETLIYDPAP